MRSLLRRAPRRSCGSRRGRDCGLVDDDAASIAATGALKDIMQMSAPE